MARHVGTRPWLPPWPSQPPRASHPLRPIMRPNMETCTRRTLLSPPTPHRRARPRVSRPLQSPCAAPAHARWHRRHGHLGTSSPLPPSRSMLPFHPRRAPAACTTQLDLEHAWPQCAPHGSSPGRTGRLRASISSIGSPASTGAGRQTASPAAAYSTRRDAPSVTRPPRPCTTSSSPVPSPGRSGTRCCTGSGSPAPCLTVSPHLMTGGKRRGSSLRNPCARASPPRPSSSHG